MRCLRCITAVSVSVHTFRLCYLIFFCILLLSIQQSNFRYKKNSPYLISSELLLGLFYFLSDLLLQRNAYRLWFIVCVYSFSILIFLQYPNDNKPVLLGVIRSTTQQVTTAQSQVDEFVSAENDNDQNRNCFNVFTNMSDVIAVLVNLLHYLLFYTDDHIPE